MNRKGWKERLGRAFRLYTLLVTLITVLMIVLGSLLDRERVFGYEAFLSPLLYALIGTVATMVTWTDREPGMREVIVRKAVSLLLIEGAILLVVLSSDTVPTEKSWTVLGIALGVFAVFLLANLIFFAIDRREAEKISEDLARYQAKQSGAGPG